MKKLTIVIVNYNVRFFLEQTLQSVFLSEFEYDFEVFVVDNNSTDGSVQMVLEQFPDVKVIANKENYGFSRANNQAIKKSQSEYVLLLNPDTLLGECTLQYSTKFMDSHQSCGAHGVKMIDGTGSFLPESKRGFPTPWTSFCKMSGLSALFPNSRFFNQYHLGFLDKDKNHKVQVLSGAYMYLRRETLAETGLLDEDFFMYGEDIDLSYRIDSTKYDNYYLATAPIIHFKGESTKKSSVNFIRIFYKAMIIFAGKHYKTSGLNLYAGFLSIAVYFKAFLTLIGNIWRKISFPLIDAVTIWSTGYLIKELWENYYYNNDLYYSSSFLVSGLLGYSIVYVFTLFMHGIYDGKPSLRLMLKAIITSSIILIAGYGLLDESQRFSRVVIALLSAATFIVLPLWRQVYSFFFENSSFWQINSDFKHAIIGNPKYADDINKSLLSRNSKYNCEEVIEAKELNGLEKGNNSFRRIVSKFTEKDISTIVFTYPEIKGKTIIQLMESLGSNFHYHFYQVGNQHIIGSTSKNEQSELISYKNQYALSNITARRQKFLIDRILGMISLLLSPILVFFMTAKAQFFRNIFSLIFHRRTWVGFSQEAELDKSLPHLPPGMITTVEAMQDEEFRNEKIADRNYALEYSPVLDISSFIRQFDKLDRK